MSKPSALDETTRDLAVKVEALIGVVCIRLDRNLAGPRLVGTADVQLRDFYEVWKAASDASNAHRQLFGRPTTAIVALTDFITSLRLANAELWKRFVSGDGSFLGPDVDHALVDVPWAMEDAERACRNILDQPRRDPTTDHRTPIKVKVSADGSTVTVDGVTERLQGQRDGEFIRLLVKEPGAAIKADALECALGERPSRIYKRLPKIIAEHISKPGRGQTGYIFNP